MRIATKEEAVTGNVDRDYAACRRWLADNWAPEDRQAVLQAIQDSVGAELLARDTREYGIPPSGQVTTITTGDNGKEKRVADPVKQAQRHNGRDVRIETDRRWRAWVRLLPSPVFAGQWVILAQEHDGRTADGKHWLCQGHQGKRDTRGDYKTGFIDELPSWIAPDAMKGLGASAPNSANAMA